MRDWPPIGPSEPDAGWLTIHTLPLSYANLPPNEILPLSPDAGLKVAHRSTSVGRFCFGEKRITGLWDVGADQPSVFIDVVHANGRSLIGENHIKGTKHICRKELT